MIRLLAVVAVCVGLVTGVAPFLVGGAVYLAGACLLEKRAPS